MSRGSAWERCVCVFACGLTDFLMRLFVRSRYMVTQRAQKSQVESCSCRISVAGGPKTSLDFWRVCL